MGEETPADWPAYFEEKFAGDLPKYARERWYYNTPIWETIHRKLPRGGKILECGSGPGTYGIMLARMGYDFTGVEIEADMISMAEHQVDVFGTGPGSIRFEQGSILDLSSYYGKYDLAYSSGVLEHFYHDDAVEVMRQEARTAPHVFVLVPSHYCWERSRATTDGIYERYTVERLERVVNEAGLEIIERIGWSAGNKVGRAVELLVPPIIQKRIFPHFAATIGVFCRSRDFSPVH